MKKWLAILLVFVMVLSVASNAFASVGTVVKEVVSLSGTQTNSNKASNPEQTFRSKGSANFVAQGRASADNTLSTRSTDKLYGFINYGYGSFCWAEIDVNSPDSYSIISSVKNCDVYAAEYDCVTDETYAVWYDSYDNIYFGVADVATGKLDVFGAAPEHISALAIDYTTYTLYAVAVDTATLYEVDMDNGEFVTLGVVTNTVGYPLMMSVSGDGTIYIIDNEGMLYTLDANTLEANEIGHTGMTLSYAQSMTYDNVAGKLYWAHYDITGALYEVDVETAEAVYLGSVGEAEICGLHTRPEKESVVLPDSVDIEGIEITTDNEVMLAQYSTCKIFTVLQPAGGFFEDRTVEWISSNEEVATVSGRGIVTGIAPGTTIITAKTVSGAFQDTCSITVIAAEEYYRDISDAMNTAEFGEDNYFVFSTGVGSSYPFVVDELNGGVVSTNEGVSPSTATIQNCKPEWFIGGSTITWDWNLECGFGYEEGVFFVNDVFCDFAWQNEGWITASYTIPVTGYYTFTWGLIRSYDWIDEAKLWVDNVTVEMLEPAVLQGITLHPDEILLMPKDTIQLQVEYDPINASNSNVTYTSLNPSVATVTDDGIVEGITKGDTVIVVVAEHGGYTKELPVKVRESVTIDEINYRPAQIGSTYDFVLGGDESQILDTGYICNIAYGVVLDMQMGDAATFILSPGDVNPINDPRIAILDSNYNILIEQEDSDTSLFPSVKFIPDKPGKYYVLVTTMYYYNEERGSCSLEIERYNPVRVDAIDMVSDVIKVGFDMYAQATARLLPANTDYPGIIWSVEDANIATVDKNGRLYGLSIGRTEVVATSVDGGYEATATVIVGEQPLPRYDNKVYGFNLYDDSGKLTRGFVSYEMGEDDAEVSQVSALEKDIYAGAYANGMIYAYEYIDHFFYSELLYTVFDAATLAVQENIPSNTNGVIPIEMAYNYLTGIMYTSAMDPMTGICGLYIVDIQTGELTFVGDFDIGDPEYPLLMYAMDFDNNGNLYGIGGDGIYYSIQTTNAATTQIRDTGYVPFVIQSMAFNHNQGVMYWFKLDSDSSAIVALDPETGCEVITTDTNTTGTIQVTTAFIYTSPDMIKPNAPILLEEINTDKTELTLNVRESARLNVEYMPENTTERGITWHSTHPSVAFVDSTGKVIGVNAGTAYVVATSSNGLTSSTLITVNSLPPSEIPEGYARITLTAGDLWGDGTGYQLLLDANASVADEGILYEDIVSLGYNDIPDEIYNKFEYKIPENADGMLNTSNIVFDDSVTIYVPAGVYDWCVTNPTPSWGMYIAGNGVGISYVFYEGFAYDFNVEAAAFGENVAITREYVGTDKPLPALVHTVTFVDYDDAILATLIVEDGADVLPAATPKRDYWLFYEWIGGSLTEVKTDLTIKALYHMKGDVNMDNAVNTGDAALILMYIVQPGLLDDYNVLLGNINNDEATNTGDAAMILMIAVDLIPAPW